MSSYDGKASLVFSSGDAFAECHLVASSDGDGWTGEVTDILFRTQMVPTPLNADARTSASTTWTARRSWRSR